MTAKVYDEHGAVQCGDGTVWIYAPGLDIFTGWQPGEDGCWSLSPDEFREGYPEAYDLLRGPSS